MLSSLWCLEPYGVSQVKDFNSHEVLTAAQAHMVHTVEWTEARTAALWSQDETQAVALLRQETRN